MQFAERIYVDERRISDYFEKLGRRKKTERRPSVTLGLALTGPRVDAKFDSVNADYSLSEKVDAVQAYLEQSHRIHLGPVPHPFELDERSRNRENRQFAQEDCFATTILIPEQRQSVDRLVMWVSMPADRELPIDWPGEAPGYHQLGSLFLIQDAHASDPEMFNAISGYSALMMLQSDLSKDREQALLSTQASARFGRDPIGVLTEIGARVGARKKIRVLYRIRAMLMEQSDDFSVVTIAYPIVIDAI